MNAQAFKYIYLNNMILLFLVVLVGGKDWSILSKGTDITESFETHHLFGVPQKLLDNFWVKKATSPRKVRFTFDENEFFKTIQKGGAAILRKGGTGPTLLFTLTVDFLVVSFLLILCLLSFYPSMPLAFVTGRFSQSFHY